MKKAIQKAKNGEEVTVVFLGGSITLPMEGPKDCFATLSYNRFKEKFGTSGQVNYVNAGMNGTSSMVGLIRVERDVLNYNPDIVFVEYSVNDSREIISREIFESLVLRLLKSKTKPAVVLIFMISEAGYTCQGHMQAIGEYYNLPMISAGDAIMPEIEAKRFSWSDFSNDFAHPNMSGNAMVTEFIAHYFDIADTGQWDEDITIPNEPFIGNSFTGMKMMDSSNAPVMACGAFIREQTIREFPNGWIHRPSPDNKCFLLKISCRSFFVIYKEDNNINEGNAQVYIDGSLRCTLSGYRTFGWGNPVSQIILKEEAAAKHLIEIKMAPGDEDKSFTILGFGYCE
jgi:lysophospholipase L1-like esterase